MSTAHKFGALFIAVALSGGCSNRHSVQMSSTKTSNDGASVRVASHSKFANTTEKRDVVADVPDGMKSHVLDLSSLEVEQGSILVKLFAPDGTVKADGVRWRFKRGLPYVASPVQDGSHLYLVKNGGFLTCLDAVTGKAAYQEERLGASGDYYASPTLAAGHLYVASQPGIVTVVKAGSKFEVISRNDLGEAIQASPAVVGSTLYLRTASKLYAFGPSNITR